ncbi:E3 ubiquitin-protein ligase HERC [Acrasis kona]|uniref:E3 ubiquitin-protein ligase HERC n=1 Tax=Acrasis kona TaxID=1008807 RepID=A0AAW2ZR16_9EUKA
MTHERKRRRLNDDLPHVVSDEQCCSIEEFITTSKEKMGTLLRLADVSIRFQNLTENEDLVGRDEMVLLSLMKRKLRGKNCESSVWTYGSASMGQLGHGDTSKRVIPEPMTTLPNKYFLSAAAGWGHTVLVDKSGLVYSCGFNNYGQLGLGHQKFTPTPCVIESLQEYKITKVSVNSSCHTIAIEDTGRVFVWGCNQFGQLGLGQRGHRLSPSEITCLRDRNIKDIYAGGGANEGYCFVVDSNQKMYSWGKNSRGQLGLGETNKQMDEPTLVATSFKPLKLALGASHVVAITSNDEVCSWGANDEGALGMESFSQLGQCDFPREIVSLRGKHILSCFIFLENGDIYAWGKSPTQDNWNVPHLLPGIGGVTLIGAGFSHCIAYTKDGKLYGWGNGTHGQLGNGTLKNRDAPDEAIFKEKGVVVVCGGGHHSVVLTNPFCK